MGFKFEKLIIWQNAMEFGESIFKLSHKFPKDEMYNLFSQIRRAVDSVALIFQKVQLDNRVLNLKNLSVFQFRSLAEVVTCLHKARRREYISEAEFKKHYEFAFNLMNMMISFREKIK